jgi:tRNA(Arg) A34 adenosine deaminase TadA
LTVNKSHFIKLAIENSAKNLNGINGGPFGAVIVKEGKVIASATNQVRALNDPTAHAEIQAIRQACQKLNTYDLSGCEIYSSCEPCPMCLGAIYWSGMKNVYYAADSFDARKAGFDDQLIYEDLQKPHPDKHIKLIPLEKSEALAVFSEWQRNNPWE